MRWKMGWTGADAWLTIQTMHPRRITPQICNLICRYTAFVGRLEGHKAQSLHIANNVHTIARPVMLILRIKAYSGAPGQGPLCGQRTAQRNSRFRWLRGCHSQPKPYAKIPAPGSKHASALDAALSMAYDSGSAPVQSKPSSSSRCIRSACSTRLRRAMRWIAHLHQQEQQQLQRVVPKQ